MEQILIVTSDRGIVSGRSTLIASLGRGIHTAVSVDQALRLLDADTPIDLIIADLEQDPEGHTGLDLCRAVSRRDQPPSRLLLFFPEQLAVAQEAQRTGLATDILVRREMPSMLARKVAQMLRDRAEESRGAP